MLRMFQRYFTTISPVFLDGSLYALIALFTFMQSYFGGDEAAKFISPTFKFWLNGFIGGSATVFAAVKMFRSTAFAEHQETKKDIIINNNNNLDPNS